jgi:Cu/Zn superoxide dismutase
MRHLFSGAVAASAVLILSGIAGATAARAAIRLAPLNNSGETAVATLVQQADGSLLVTVLTRNGGNGPQPVHIHQGACADNGPVAYKLETATNGRSVTKLKGVKLADLAARANVINIHKSTAEMGTYVACGLIAT